MDDVSPRAPEPIDDDAHERRVDDLRRSAAANEQATWGDAERNRVRVPGILSGDVGPKGKVAAQLRSVSRAEMIRGGEVPFGTTVPGTGRVVVVAMAGIILGLLLIIGVVVWLSW